MEGVSDVGGSSIRKKTAREKVCPETHLPSLKMEWEGSRYDCDIQRDTYTYTGYTK